MLPLTSERNFTPSSTALSAPWSTSPGAAVLGQMVNPADKMMVMLKELNADCAAESVTATVKLKVPVAVGVPEMTPLADRLSPVGSVPEESDQVYGGDPPLAVSVAV
jgi:hypothetical protein